MLVLTRRPDEEIVIADNIRVKVLEVRGNRVRLGLVADRSISIRRAEVRDAGCPIASRENESEKAA